MKFVILASIEQVDDVDFSLSTVNNLEIAPLFKLDEFNETNPTSKTLLVTSDMISGMVDIGGILFPTKDSSSLPKLGNLIQVESTQRNMRSISLALCEGRPVLLSGPPGCGKTTLLDECCRLTKNEDCVRIHIDDQIDSKVFIIIISKF